MSCSNFSAGVGDRWEELHRLASEPREQHVLMAEQVEDATNGLLSTLSKSAVCTVASPGKAFQAGRSGLAHVEVGWEWFPEARGQEAPQEGGKQEEWGLATLVLGYPALFTSLCQALWAFSAGNLACLYGLEGSRLWDPDLGRPCACPLPQGEEPSQLSGHGQHRDTSAGRGGLCIPSCHCHGLTRRTLCERYTCA